MDGKSHTYYKHPNSLVETDRIGNGTTIWAFVHILQNSQIGKNCNICDHCFIEGDVLIGDNVTIKCGVYLWSGLTIQDNVFLGLNVVFTNDLRPRSRNQDCRLTKTVIEHGASIGANSTILAGVNIGRYAMTGIGAVVTRNVKDYALVYGNPAKQHGWVDEGGNKMNRNSEGFWVSDNGTLYVEVTAGLAKSLQ